VKGREKTQSSRGGELETDFRRARRGKTMTATTAIGMNRAGSAIANARHAARHGGFSAVNLLAAGVHGFLPPADSAAIGSRPSASRGLGRIEEKLAAGLGHICSAFSKADSFATLWITVPFAALVALGCLTLA
jgi:hypothetical protein